MPTCHNCGDLFENHSSRAEFCDEPACQAARKEKARLCVLRGSKARYERIRAEIIKQHGPWHCQECGIEIPYGKRKICDDPACEESRRLKRNKWTAKRVTDKCRRVKAVGMCKCGNVLPVGYHYGYCDTCRERITKYWDAGMQEVVL